MEIEVRVGIVYLKDIVILLKLRVIVFFFLILVEVNIVVLFDDDLVIKLFVF